MEIIVTLISYIGLIFLYSCLVYILFGRFILKIFSWKRNWLRWINGLTHGFISIIVLSVFIVSFLSTTWEGCLSVGDMVVLGDWVCICTYQGLHTGLQGVATESLHIEVVVLDTVSFQKSILEYGTPEKRLFFDVNVPFQLTKVYLSQAQEWKTLAAYSFSPFMGEWTFSFQHPFFNLNGPWWVRIENKQGLLTLWASGFGVLVTSSAQGLHYYFKTKEK